MKIYYYLFNLAINCFENMDNLALNITLAFTFTPFLSVSIELIR